jgi:hypothetical protein
LKDKWITAYSAISYCKNIRNQYAHCHWQLTDEKLAFLNLDEEAKSQAGEMNVTFRLIDQPLLEEQLQYFDYAVNWLYHLRDQLILAAGKKTQSQPFPAPKPIRQPPRDNRPA